MFVGNKVVELKFGSSIVCAWGGGRAVGNGPKQFKENVSLIHLEDRHFFIFLNFLIQI